MPVGFQTGVDMTNAALNRMRSGGGGSKMSKREKKFMDEQIKNLRQERKFDKKDRKEAARKRELLEPNELEALERDEARSAIKGKIQENRKQKYLNKQKKLENERAAEKLKADQAAGVFRAEADEKAEGFRNKLWESQQKRAAREEFRAPYHEVQQALVKGQQEIDAKNADTENKRAMTAHQKAQTATIVENNKTLHERNQADIDYKLAQTEEIAAGIEQTLSETARKEQDAKTKTESLSLLNDGLGVATWMMSMVPHAGDPEAAIAAIRENVLSLHSSAAALGPEQLKVVDTFMSNLETMETDVKDSILHKERQKIKGREEAISVQLEAKSKANPAFRRQYDSWTPEMKREHDVTAYVREKINATGNVHMNQLMNDPARKGMFIKYKLHNDPNQRWAMDAKGNQLKTKDGQLVPNLIIDEDATFAALNATLAQYKAMGPLPRSKTQSSLAGREEIPATSSPVVPVAGAALPPPKPIRLETDTNTVATEGTPHPWGETAWQDYRLAQNAPSTAAELLSSMEGGAGEHDLWLAQQGALEALSLADQQRLAQWTNPSLPANLQPSPTGGPPAHQTNPPTHLSPPTPTIHIPGHHQTMPPPTGQPPTGQPPAGQPTAPTGQQPAPTPAPTAPTQTQSQQAIPKRMSGVTIAGTGGNSSRPFDATTMHAAIVKRAGGNQPTMAAEVIEFMGEVGIEIDKGSTDEAINAAKLMARTNVEGSYGANQLMSDNLRPMDDATKKLAPRFKGSLIGSIRKTLFGDTEFGGRDVDVDKLESALKGNIGVLSRGDKKGYGKSALKTRTVTNLWDKPAEDWPSKIYLPMENGDTDDSDVIQWTPEKVKTFKRRVESWKKWKAFKDKIDKIK